LPWHITPNDVAFGQETFIGRIRAGQGGQAKPAQDEVNAQQAIQAYWQVGDTTRTLARLMPLHDGTPTIVYP
jgi:hypothetical protein